MWTHARRQSVDKAKVKALYDAGKTDKEIAATLGVSSNAVGHWRRKQGLTAHVAEKAETQKCDGCDFWQNSGGEGFRFCHHLLITGKRRVEENGVCMSHSKGGKK